MDDLWTVRRFCRWKYNLPDGAEPKKSHINSISKQCRDGKLPAIKVCNRWRIDTSEILRGLKHDQKQSGAE